MEETCGDCFLEIFVKDFLRFLGGRDLVFGDALDMLRLTTCWAFMRD